VIKSHFNSFESSLRISDQSWNPIAKLPKRKKTFVFSKSIFLCDFLFKTVFLRFKRLKLMRSKLSLEKSFCGRDWKISGPPFSKNSGSHGRLFSKSEWKKGPFRDRNSILRTNKIFMKAKKKLAQNWWEKILTERNFWWRVGFLRRWQIFLVVWEDGKGIIVSHFSQ